MPMSSEAIPPAWLRCLTRVLAVALTLATLPVSGAADQQLPEGDRTLELRVVYQ